MPQTRPRVELTFEQLIFSLEYKASPLSQICEG